MHSNILETFGRLIRIAGLAICIAVTAGCLGTAGGSQNDDSVNDGSSDSGDSGGGSNDASGEFRLSSATYTVDEDGGSITIPVQRVNGSDGELAVEYSTRQLDTSDSSHARDADFSKGDDYEGTFGTLTFPDGVTEKQFTVPITDDPDDNPNLTFEVYLFNPSISTAQPDVATVTIIDNDEASAGTGSATIHWTAPTTRTDGSSLTLSQISGFVVYEGTAPDDLTRVATVDDGAAVDVTLNDLVSGDHYFAVSTQDTDGLEGPKSEVVSFTVN